jgi:plasmid stabilization system protein ParE
VKLVWSESALADLERFAVFLQERHPVFAKRIAAEIVRRARMIAAYPEIGRSVGHDGGYRELSMPVLNATYVFRYSLGHDHVRMLRVFHGREQREL